MYRHGQEEIRAVTSVLRSGQWFRYGDPADGHLGEASALEAEWSDAIGTEHSCFTANGTAALMCAYAGLGIGPGDEVIVPGYTWITTALAPLHLGAIPVVVDVNESLTIDPDAVEQAITPRTKAISPVHMNGLMADMDKIQQIATQHQLAVIEDACQCDGGKWYDGRQAGTIGDVGAFSFNIHKVISCGDGGMLVTNRQDVFERAMIYHDTGLKFRDRVPEGARFFAGINVRGSEILAALMRVQLSRLDGIIADLQRNRRRILRQIEGVAAPVPYNGGTETGTGAFIGLRFDDQDAAIRFCGKFNADASVKDVEAYRPIDSGPHVYSNWEPIMCGRGAHVEAADPFRHPLNAEAPTYSEDMLPKTLEILGTSVLINVNPDWEQDDCDSVSSLIATLYRSGQDSR